jgi:hypothetical protein
MGAGVALEFKKRYPTMFSDYKQKCYLKEIKPGDCYVYKEVDGVYILGLAVKNDWKQWSTMEWIDQSIKSMKLIIMESDIKSVSMPLPGGKNGRRGPYGPVPNFTVPIEDKIELTKFIEKQLSSFADKFNIEINLCIPSDVVVAVPKKDDLTLDQFFSV